MYNNSKHYSHNTRHARVFWRLKDPKIEPSFAFKIGKKCILFQKWQKLGLKTKHFTAQRRSKQKNPLG